MIILTTSTTRASLSALLYLLARLPEPTVLDTTQPEAPAADQPEACDGAQRNEACGGESPAAARREPSEPSKPADYEALHLYNAALRAAPSDEAFDDIIEAGWEAFLPSEEVMLPGWQQAPAIPVTASRSNMVRFIAEDYRRQLASMDDQRLARLYGEVAGQYLKG